MSLQVSFFLVNYSINCIIDNFLCCFICSAQSWAFFFLCHHFLAVDETFLKVCFVQSLLLTVIINVNKQNTLLTWAVMKSESQRSWEYFLWHLRRAILKVLSEKCTLMSDCDKELLKADSSNLDSLLKSMSSSFFIDLEPLSQTAVMFLHSWIGSLWVLMCFLRYCILFTWQDSGFFC